MTESACERAIKGSDCRHCVHLQLNRIYMNVVCEWHKWICTNVMYVSMNGTLCSKQWTSASMRPKIPFFVKVFFSLPPLTPHSHAPFFRLCFVCVCVVQHCFQRRDEILLIGNVRDALRILNVPKYIRYFVLSFFIRSPLFAFEFNIFFTIIRQSLCVVASTSTVAWLSVACFRFLPPMCK